MRNALKGLIIAAGLVVALGGVSTASAETAWQKHHPRRVEVNQRLANQNRRIRDERKEGDITRAQANTLHRDDLRMRTQERRDAAQNGGHITAGEQGQLNREENNTSAHIPQ